VRVFNSTGCELCSRLSVAWLPIARFSPHMMLDHTQEGHRPKHPKDERTESGATDAPLCLTRAPSERTNPDLVSPDTLGVASGRESRIRYNSVDVIAGLAY